MTMQTRSEDGFQHDGPDLDVGERDGAAVTTPLPPRKKQRRGFAAMDPAKQREIASKGGRASHAAGTGHEWNSDAARVAGRKGGLASHGGRGRDALPLNRGEVSAAPANRSE